MAILVTGGAGYIGSHTVVELQNAGYDVVVLDNLSNASEKSLERVSKITGKPVKFYKADILDRDALNEVFDKEDIEGLILKEKIKIPNLEKVAKNRTTNINNYLIKEKGINSKQIVIINKIENNSSSINLNISKK